MYNIAFFENGVFATNIGGPVQTLPEAIAQIKRLVANLDAKELDVYFGYKYDRYDTPCAVLITDRWHMPIINSKEEEV